VIQNNVVVRHHRQIQFTCLGFSKEEVDGIETEKATSSLDYFVENVTIVACERFNDTADKYNLLASMFTEELWPENMSLFIAVSMENCLHVPLSQIVHTYIERTLVPQLFARYSVRIDAQTLRCYPATIFVNGICNSTTYIPSDVPGYTIKLHHSCFSKLVWPVIASFISVDVKMDILVNCNPPILFSVINKKISDFTEREVKLVNRSDADTQITCIVQINESVVRLKRCTITFSPASNLVQFFQPLLF